MSEFKKENINNIIEISNTVNTLNNQIKSDINKESNGENISLSLQNCIQQKNNLPIKDKYLTEREFPKTEIMSSVIYLINKIIKQQDAKWTILINV